MKQRHPAAWQGGAKFQSRLILRFRNSILPVHTTVHVPFPGIATCHCDLAIGGIKNVPPQPEQRPDLAMVSPN